VSEQLEKGSAELPFPAMPFYVRDWLAGRAVRTMTPEQRGAFIQLLCDAWADPIAPCSLSDDDAELAVLSGLFTRWADAGAKVREQFKTPEEMRAIGYDVPNDSRLRNPKQWTVYRAMIEHRARKAESGRRGMASRYGPRPPRDTWITPYAEAWREQYQGEMSIGPATRPLSKLRKDFGEEETLKRWRHYLAATEALYASPARFAATFGTWEKAGAKSFDMERARERWTFYGNMQLTNWATVEPRLSQIEPVLRAELEKVKPWQIARTARDVTAAIAEVARRLAA
jgi:hypothetical protein